MAKAKGGRPIRPKPGVAPNRLYDDRPTPGPLFNFRTSNSSVDATAFDGRRVQAASRLSSRASERASERGEELIESEGSRQRSWSSRKFMVGAIPPPL